MRAAKTEYLLDKELNHVLAALTPENELACRIMLHTGLRITDVLALESDKISSKFWITEKKTGKRRQVGIPADLLAEMREIAGRKYVFESRTNPWKHRTRQAVWADIKRASRAFRLSQNAGTHSMRKIYAVELMEKYGDIDRVRRALNHDSASTTMIYAMADKLLERKLAAKRRRRKGRRA